MIRNKVLEYFKGDELATDVFLAKYSLNGKETPDEMHKRLAKEFARIEKSYITKYKDNIKNIDVFCLSNYGRTKYLNQIHGKEDPEDNIYNLFKDFKYIIPGGSVLQGLGSNKPVSLSNCFVIASPEDNIEDIMNTARDAAQIYKRRGGVGFDISNLRPRGAVVNNSANSSTGSVSFMELFSNITETVCQEGRRGALMLATDVNHPDVFEFATIKKNLSKITGANISIRLNNEFLKAVENDEDYLLSYPCRSSKEVYNGLIDLNRTLDTFEYNKLYSLNWATTKYFKKVKARELWNVIIDGAYQSAEPGIFNWERLINYDPSGVYEQLKPICTNPCGELGLAGYDSCRLITVNLYSLVKNPFIKESYIDNQEAYKIFYECQILADNLVELELEAIDKILDKIELKWRNDLLKCDTYDNVEKEFESDYLPNYSEEFKLWWKVRKKGALGRRTGTGITAYGDLCAALGVPYGDKIITNNLFYIKLKAELDASIDMAILRGTFPLWNKEKEYYESDSLTYYFGNNWYRFIHDNFTESFSRMYTYGRRNVGLSTIAPTGSISILTQTTSGIEPLFQPYYTRRKKCLPDEKPDFVDNNGVGFKEFIVIHPKFKEWAKLNIGFEREEEIDWNLAYTQSPWFNQTSSNINWEDRINIQALIQRYITSSISSTVNLPKETSKETISNLYKRAFEKGCKGVTVYRDGSRSGILVNSDSKNNETFKYNNAPKRPKELKANLHLAKSKGQTFAVIVGLLEDKPYEVFVYNTYGTKLKECSGNIVKVKQGHYKFVSENLVIDNISELFNMDEEKSCALYTSMLLRHGANIHYVIKTAKKIDDNITSFVSAMCRVLNKYDVIKEESVCSECGGKIIKEGGCEKCQDCGSSKCS